MGAEGGIEHCVVSDPGTFARLTAHIYFPTDYRDCPIDDCARHRSTDAIIDELPDGSVVCSYSSMYDHASLYALRDIAKDAEKPFPHDTRFSVHEPWIGDFDWRTLIVTDPRSLNGGRLIGPGLLDGLRSMVEIYELYSDEKRYEMALAIEDAQYPALDMKLRDWAPLLLAVMGPVHSEETWT